MTRKRYKTEKGFWEFLKRKSAEGLSIDVAEYYPYGSDQKTIAAYVHDRTKTNKIKITACEVATTI